MSPERILLVQESPHVAALASRLLKMDLPAAEVVEVRTVDELEDAVSSASWDLLVTDNHFSWGNGLVVLSILRRHLPGCPAIMLTESGSEEIAAQALKSGFADYVPATPRGYLGLGRKVRNALAEGAPARVSGLVAQHERLLNLLDEAVFVATQDAYLLQVNPAFSRLVGLSDSNAARGRRLADFFNGDSVSAFLGTLDPKGDSQSASLLLKDGVRCVPVRACLVHQGTRFPNLVVGTILAAPHRPDPRPDDKDDVYEEDDIDGAFNLDNVDLDKVLDRVLQQLDQAIEKAHGTVVRGEMPHVQGNYLDMVRLFHNLLSSVIRSHAYEPFRLELSALKMPVEWLFIVKDEARPSVGPLRIDDLASQRLVPRSAGRSKGLGVAQAIIERQGGRLWVASESDAALHIYFTLATTEHAQEQEQVDGSSAANGV